MSLFTRQSTATQIVAYNHQKNKLIVQNNFQIKKHWEIL